MADAADNTRDNSRDNTGYDPENNGDTSSNNSRYTSNNGVSNTLYPNNIVTRMGIGGSLLNITPLFERAISGTVSDSIINTGLFNRQFLDEVINDLVPEEVDAIGTDSDNDDSNVYDPNLNQSNVHDTDDSNTRVSNEILLNEVEREDIATEETFNIINMRDGRVISIFYDIRTHICDFIREADKVLVSSCWLTCPVIMQEFASIDSEVLMGYSETYDTSSNVYNRLLHNKLLKSTQSLTIWNDKNRLMHNKFIVFIRYNGHMHTPYAVLTGSYNFTINARNNHENCIYIEDNNAAEEYEKEFRRLVEMASK
jgi:hypothetical protein